MHFDQIGWRPLLCGAVLTSFSLPSFANFQVTSGTASPNAVSAGATVTLAASVESSAAASNVIVDLEVYNASGTKVGQTYYQGQNFTAGESALYSYKYQLPTGAATGQYSFKLGVFAAGWTGEEYWDNAAASFTLSAPAATTSGSQGTVPNGLPSTLFVGLGAQPGNGLNWVKGSGVPWAACYQYISSGVLPGESWVTNWGTNFAYNYAVAAHASGCIPEFTYYQIVPTGGEGAQAETATLNNAATMADYYKDFTALLQQLHSYGSAAIIHVEPDMFGFFEQVNSNPAAIKASVASSGNADIAGYPNTLAGFGEALLHLRDLYAPNVVMAAHVSEWLWNLSTSASLDVTSIAKTDAAFMTGLGNWDLFFTDISDRDAGYYQYVENDGGAHWWDATNEKYPNFNRFNTWATAFTTAAHKRLVIWQIPIGNTIMDTVNNTNFHYQDNREQYWLENYPNSQAMSALAKAGVIGLLFGAGNSGTTENFDNAGDGITNPAPINGNTQKATYADDDGGLLRINVGKYYHSGATPLPY